MATGGSVGLKEYQALILKKNAKEELLVSLRDAAIDILELRAEDSRRQAEKDFEEIPLAIRKVATSFSI